MINMAQTPLERKGSTLQQEDRNHLELITGIGKRMSLLLDDLLDVSLLKDKRIRLDVQSIHLGSAHKARWICSVRWRRASESSSYARSRIPSQGMGR